jgi:bacillithiol biosynthesis cysteine-adding enzyme BshC
MEAACIRQTLLPRASRLFEDYSYHFDEVARFYRHDPHDATSFHRAAAELSSYPEERRARLIEALRPLNPDSRALETLAKPGALAVVTGQQVGLFTGPAYTIYKALTAVRIAQRLCDEGLPAAPVFWLATEDHDFAEVNHAWIFGPEHEPVRLQARAAAEDHRPVGSLELADIPIDTLRSLLDGFPFGGEVADAAAQAYAAGAPMGGAFRALLKRVLAPFDLVYVDPLVPAFRAVGAPLLRAAVERSADLKRRVLERNRQLESAGYHAQVHIEPGTSFFFLLEGGRRLTLRVRNGGWESAETVYSTAELMNMAERLSPNALLRPVFQDFALPTVTYVGGPAELAYLAQAEPIYSELLGRMPVAVHRASFTLLDYRAAKLMERYALSWPLIFDGEEGIASAISRRLVPESIGHAFQRASTAVHSALEELSRELEAFDPTLKAALARSRSKIAYQFSKIEAKTAREALRRNDRAMRETKFLAGLLYPQKHLQERLYTILPFVAKHGFDLVSRLYDNVRLDCPDHQTMVIS